jgi:hypothetical protein
VSDPSSPERPDETGTNPDEEYAETYLAGYVEGARSVLKDLLGQASHGRTVGELRVLVQSRLAHLPEEVELRRRRLLASPRASPWAPVLPRPGPPRPWGGGVASPRLVAGSQVLVREERPRRAVELAREAVGRFPIALIVSPDPPSFMDVPAEKLRTFVVGAGGPGLTPESLAGQLTGPMQAEGGALVYLDGIETISLQDGGETALRFVNWLLAQARESGSAVVAAVHPRVLSPKDQSLLERAFQVVL